MQDKVAVQRMRAYFAERGRDFAQEARQLGQPRL